MNEVLTKEYVKSKLATNDAWLLRGLLAIYEHQTKDEQNKLMTAEQNFVGFNKVDAQILSSIAEQYLTKNFISDKQKALVRGRLTKYAGQLVRIAEGKN